MIINLHIEYAEEYFYGVSLIVAAMVNIVLSCMMMFDSNNYLYEENPRYLRARRLTSLSLLVFGLGFFFHWLFMPHFNNLLMGKALSFTYFHIGGVLFSMSHTSLIDRHYLDRKVVVRDVTILVLSLTIYWIHAFVGNKTLTYIGSALFFLHIGFLTWQFYSRFSRIYKQLGAYADYKPNDTDHEVLWLHYSCHLIISFGISGMLCTVVFHDATWPFIILLFMGIFVFSYIYKALDSFGAVVNEAEENLVESEEYIRNENENVNENRFISDEIKNRIEQWVEDRRYTDPDLTIKDALEQMGITEYTLNYYLEIHLSMKGYRQWLPYLRIQEAKRLMREHPEYMLDVIAHDCGYSAASSLSRSFKTLEGMTPMEWVKRTGKEIGR